MKGILDFFFSLVRLNVSLFFPIPSCYAGVPGGDYINANFIDGYRRQGAYIATQGPMPDTFSDFWRMVWEQHTANIIMITKLEEKSRVRALNYTYTDHTMCGVTQALFQNLV